MKEEFKDIKGYEGLYQISNTGKIKSLKRMVVRNNNRPLLVEEKILKPSVDKRGYLYVGLLKNGIKKTYSVHRLVAEAFIQNPNNLPQVNHKDENKQNNCVKNLELCDAKYNNNYGTRNKRIAEKISKKLINGKTSKQVLQIDKTTNEVIAEFPSVSEVQRQLGIRKSNISACCLGKPNHNIAGGFKWQYKKEDY